MVVWIVDEYNNTCQPSIGEKSIDADISTFTGEIESNHKTPKFKVVVESGLICLRIFSAKVSPKSSRKNNCEKIIIGHIKWKI